MSEAGADDPPPPPEAVEVTHGLDIPPLDLTFLSQQLNSTDYNSLDRHDFVIDDLDLDFDFSFDDLDLPADADDFLHPDTLPCPTDPPFTVPPQFDPCPVGPFTDSSCAFKSTYPESRHLPDYNFSAQEPCQISGVRAFSDSRVLSSTAPGDPACDIPGYLDVPSPERIDSSGGASQQRSENKGSDDARGLSCPSPESQVSGNSGSNVSETNSVNSSLVYINNLTKNEGVDQKITFPASNPNSYNICNNKNNKKNLLKRKKESEDSSSNKIELTNGTCGISNHLNENSISNLTSEEEEKKRTRLIRNRESAQLSRQRKKHYVEELEDKVRTMHSTIQDLNAKISYIMAENTSLRQQLGSGRGGVPPPMPAAPGMYPHMPMMYPWMPCAPYMVKPQGSQVPLVPIPRLKPQQTVSAMKSNKKPESKKNERKTRKVASVSFIGLLLLMLLFGVLVPMVNVRYGGITESGLDHVENKFNEHHGRVLSVNQTGYGKIFDSRRDYSNNSHFAQRCHGIGQLSVEHGSGEFGPCGNGSGPLVASLYVPRNDKLVKIDGNLIIHSILASEKALASRGDDGRNSGIETSLAVPGNLARGNLAGRHSHPYPRTEKQQRALGSSSAHNDRLQSPVADGRLHQWFREGLAGPMLSSGMCTEVFHFDVSPASAPGAIVPATSAKNVSSEHRQNSTRIVKSRNRRILNGLPLPVAGTSRNISEKVSHKEKLSGNGTASSSMVVSVLVDPRETGDGNGGDVMIGQKSFPRIFVVVLIDSVKYVTYSCMLPFKGAGPHLVTT